MQRQETGIRAQSERERAMAYLRNVFVEMEKDSRGDVASDFSKAGKKLIDAPGENDDFLRTVGMLFSKTAAECREEQAERLVAQKRPLDELSTIHALAAGDAETAKLPELSKLFYTRAFNAAKAQVLNELQEGGKLLSIKIGDIQKSIERLDKIAPYVLDADGITKLNNHILDQILLNVEKLTNTTERSQRNSAYYDAVRLCALGEYVARETLQDKKRQKAFLLLRAGTEEAYSEFFTTDDPANLEARGLAAEYATIAADHYTELGGEYKAHASKMAERAGVLYEEIGDRYALRDDKWVGDYHTKAVANYNKAISTYKKFGLMDKAKALVSSDKYMELKY